MNFRKWVIVVVSCVAVGGAPGASETAAHANLQPLKPGEKVRHCRNLRFSERLRAHGSGCSEARFVARRAVRHVASDSEKGWRIDARIQGRHGGTWNCTGAGFNPLPLACRRPGRWIKLQIWAD